MTDYREEETIVYKIGPDIKDGLQKMEEIDASSLPRLHTHVDSLYWESTNPMYHPKVYKLNDDQLKM